MARRLLVSDGERAQECQPLAFKIAVGGVVKQIKAASCVEFGIVRQFWPPAPSTTDPRILWTTGSLLVIQSVADPIDSVSSIIFNRSLGTYSYKNYPNADGAGQFLDPILDGTPSDDGQYLIRVDQVSGTALTGTLATWIDINSAATHTWSLDQTIVGTLSAVANISVAKDNGAGSPVAGTTVTKSVTFSSEVRTSSQIIWSTTPYDLVEIKEAVDADCDLIFNPSGFVTGSADTSGSFTEAWHVESPNLLINPIVDRFGNFIVDRFGEEIIHRAAGEYSVKVTLVSGTAPTGSALGVALNLNEVRQWKLLATDGENLSCALDVEVDTIPTSTPVVKRITMNSERIADPLPDITWTTDPWYGTDITYEQGAGLDVIVEMNFDTVGAAEFRMHSSVMPDQQFAGEFWFPWPPAPTPSELDSYEVMITNVVGAFHVNGPTWDVWHRLTSAREFELPFTTRPDEFIYTFDALVRKVGGNAVTKTVTIRIAAAQGVNP